MSDPFDVLRFDDSADATTPDVGAIKTRAGRIERRRRVVQSSGAIAVVLIAVIGIVFSTQTNRPPNTLAQKTIETTAPVARAASGDAAAVQEQKDANTTAGSTTAGAAAGSSESRTVGGGSTVSAPGAAMTSPPPLETTVIASKTSTPHEVRFTLKVCNPNDTTVERNFATSQRYDFEITRGGKIVWRWSDGQAFAQHVGSESWKPKECRTWSETWNGMRSSGGLAPTGSYTVTGILATSPPERSKAESFCLDIC